MTKPGLELFYAVRLRTVLHYLGQFFLIVACLNLVTVAVALLYGEFRIAVGYAVVVGTLGGSGFLLSRVRESGHLQLNEAMVLATLVFFFVPLVATVPLQDSGQAFVDAFFETVSAVTTTGLSTLGAVEARPETFVFARAWMQWYGGLGIVILSLAFVVRPGLSAMRLAVLEIPGDDLAGGARSYAKKVLSVYLCLTGAGFLLWLLLGGKPVEGLHYILAAVSTGGFAPTDNSFADLESLRLAWGVTLACLAGAMPLILYHSGWRSRWGDLLRNIELRGVLVAGLLVMLLLGASLRAQEMPWSDVLAHAPLLALSAQTTAGFSSLDPGTLDMTSKMVLILAMSIGGSVGSTAGGIKMMRLLILFSLLLRFIVRMGLPANAVSSRKVGGRMLTDVEIQESLVLILVFIGVVVLSWIPFLYHGYNPIDALFEVVSATATVGLSSGISSTAMPAALKLVLCADMLFGRLEMIAWLVLLYPRTWFGRQRGS